MPHAGRTIRELRVRHETGPIIVALRKADGTFDTTPEPEASIDAGDVLIGVGTPEEIRRLEDLFAPREALAG
ncbi:MAG: cation:proton antiporter regulatory subunit [Gaiellaceae bacterium]